MNAQELQEAQRVARLIAGFIAHRLTGEQRQELDDWIGDSDENLLLFEQLTDEKNIVWAHQWFSDLDILQARLKVEQKITAQQKANERPLRRAWIGIAAAAMVGIVVLFFRNFNSNEKSSPILAVIQKKDSIVPGSTAAILITGSKQRIDLGKIQNQSIVVSAHSQVQNNAGLLNYSGNLTLDTTINTLVIPAGEQYQVKLADGTKIWLNAASSLSYPVCFNGATRVVQLTGEGYFEIAQNAAKPFIVHLGGTTIKVLGTQFNVSGYQDLDQRVSLLEGSVQVWHNSRENILHTGQQAVLNANNLMVSSPENIADAIAWTKGLFSFHQQPIDQVMPQIARWYNVQVIYEGRISKKITGQIYRNSSMGQVLQMLEESGAAHFILQGKKIIVRSL